ncbi:hypothetical protein R1flu_021285 [Riccia fluitans]|uniref:Uncharacterized protein n=1 Tax=Riccia fluitans TaxID=41844 RepID=A0ABD1ZPG5_9MARC
MHTTLNKYNPRSYLPASVETKPNKKLVNGQQYEEILYYKDASPYGPTYHLITTVAELFWSATRSNRFLIPMILAYLTGFHGHLYDWAKAILHGLRIKILFLQSRARNNEEMQAAGGDSHCVPGTVCVDKKAPCRRQAAGGDSIASREQPVSTKRPRAEDKECGLPSTKKNKVINSSLLPHVEATIQRHSTAIDTWKKAYEDQLSKVRELQETNDGLRGQLVAKDAEKADVHALARTEVQCELEELKSSVTKLEFKRSVTAKEKALENAHQKEISTLKATRQKYKTVLDGEIGTNADLHAEVQNLEDDLNASKYTLEQALQAQKSAGAELLEVKKELRMLQVLHQEVDEGYRLSQVHELCLTTLVPYLAASRSRSESPTGTGHAALNANNDTCQGAKSPSPELHRYSPV